MVHYSTRGIFFSQISLTFGGFFLVLNCHQERIIFVVNGYDRDPLCTWQSDVKSHLAEIIVVLPYNRAICIGFKIIRCSFALKFRDTFHFCENLIRKKLCSIYNSDFSCSKLIKLGLRALTFAVVVSMTEDLSIFILWHYQMNFFTILKSSLPVFLCQIRVPFVVFSCKKITDASILWPIFLWLMLYMPIPKAHVQTFNAKNEHRLVRYAGSCKPSFDIVSN